jgi:DNA-binding transcriptional ArsR family regulator
MYSPSQPDAEAQRISTLPVWRHSREPIVAAVGSEDVIHGAGGRSEAMIQFRSCRYTGDRQVQCPNDDLMSARLRSWRRRVLIFNHMVEGRVLDEVYHALADSSRRAIVWRLALVGELKVTDVARPFGMSLNAVSKHIKMLERAGLVRRRIVGRDHWLSLESQPLVAAYAWIGLYQRFWEGRVDSLQQYLAGRRASADPE